MRGDGPAHLIAKNVGELTDILSGFAFKSEQFTTEPDLGMPLIRIRDLKSNETVCRYVGDFDPAYVIKSGDIVVGMDGDFLAVRWNGEDALLNQRVLRLRTSQPELLDENYLFYRMQPELIRLEQAITGTTVKHLSTKDIKRLVWDLPPLDEQRRIAEVLRSVDAAITTTQAVVVQGVALWQALAENLIWGLEVQRPECLSPLGTALRGSDYGVNVPLSLEPVGHPVLRMGNIQDGRIDPSDMKWGDVPPSDADALALNDGDILFNRTNSRDLVGKVALVREPTDCLYASYIVRLSVDRTVADPYYLFAVMHSDRAQSAFKTIATPGVSQSNINPTNLKMQSVPLPDLAAQRAIAGQLRSIEDARLGSQQQLETLQVIKKDLAPNLLSGRLRVPA